jgi:hypothetical protein
METQIKTVHFYTVGEDFTLLLRNFIKEGCVSTVLEILQDGGFPRHLIQDFFDGKYKFTGTTQNGNDLSIVTDKSEDFNDGLEQCLRSMLYKVDLEQHQVIHMLEKFQDHKDVHAFNKIYKIEDIKRKYGTNNLNTFTISKIEEGGFGVYTFNQLDNVGKFHDGLLLPTGDLVTCGYQEHNQLYPFLQELGLVKSRDWTDCDETIHISSGQISGTLAYHLESPYRKGLDENLTELQLQALFRLRKSIRSAYGSYDSVSKMLLGYSEHQEKHGGKWNNLSFLHKYYKTDLFRLPRFSKELIPNVKNCLRTSPKHSLPGLLESKFNLTENSVKELEETFEKFKDVRKDNELHYFYQEYLDGPNGVFHYDQEGFRCSVSENQGDVVQGKTGNYQLAEDELYKLETIGKELYEDLDEPIQVEFVIFDNEVYLVQLRLLKNNAERTVIVHTPEDTFLTGNTFSQGVIENVNVNEILILESDGDSELLLGKKALIVKNKVEFSHILALSKALRIPSIFATGDFKLPETGEVKFYAYGPTGWVTKTVGDE